MDIKNKYNTGFKFVLVNQAKIAIPVEVKSMMINIRDKEIADKGYDGEEIEILYNLYNANTTYWIATVDESYIDKQLESKLWEEQK